VLSWFKTSKLGEIAMGNSSESSAIHAWENLERCYQSAQTQARGFVAEAGIIGASMIRPFAIWAIWGRGHLGTSIALLHTF